MLVSSGHHSIREIFLPGDIIGLGPCLTEMPPYVAEAITPVQVCVLDGRSLPELAERQSNLALALMRLLAEQSRRWHARGTLLALRTPVQWLAYFFLDIFLRFRALSIADATMCPFYLRRTHLADAVGLSEVHVSRTLTQLRETGLIDFGPNLLIIPDTEKLAHHAKVLMPPQMKNRPIL